MHYVPWLWEYLDTMVWENTKQKFTRGVSALPKWPDFGPKNTKDLKIYEGNFFEIRFPMILFFNNLSAKIEYTIGIIAVCRYQYQHIWLMTYFWCHMHHSSSNILWCQMTFVTSKYEMNQLGRSLCLKKRLDISNRTPE